jgi:putative DNA primase/helicase
MTRLGAGDIARMLAERADQLADDLLPAGHREGSEWVVPSGVSPFGCSISIHLLGRKAGVWSAWAAGDKGDALSLVEKVLSLDIGQAMVWARRWLGIDGGEAVVPRRPVSVKPIAPEVISTKDWCRRTWESAAPTAGTIAETYLANRGLRFNDAEGLTLRFRTRHGRKGPAGSLEYHPAMLALLRDVRTGHPAGLINIYLRPDGVDRLRDPKGKTSWGAAGGAAVMLSPFDDVTMGLTICEGVETGIALVMAGLAPTWACGGASNLASFPVLAGIDALTIAVDADEPGQNAAETVAARWRQADHEVIAIAPPVGDWADPMRPA